MTDPFDAIREMQTDLAAGRPLIFIPIDEDGRDCGPPEVVQQTSDGPPLS